MRSLLACDAQPHFYGLDGCESGEQTKKGLRESSCQVHGVVEEVHFDRMPSMLTGQSLAQDDRGHRRTHNTSSHANTDIRNLSTRTKFPCQGQILDAQVERQTPQ